jgi:hypothetical protein
MSCYGDCESKQDVSEKVDVWRPPRERAWESYIRTCRILEIGKSASQELCRSELPKTNNV